MIGYIFAVVIIIFLIAVTISSNYVFVLTDQQVTKLWVSTFLMIVLIGYVRSTILGLEPISTYLFLPAGLYVIWYFLTKFTANMINKDTEAGVIRDTSF